MKWHFVFHKVSCVFIKIAGISSCETPSFSEDAKILLNEAYS